MRTIAWTIVVAMLMAAGYPSPATAGTGTFTAAASMDIPRGSLGTATLSDGDVLVAGGYYSSGHAVTNTAELYNPSTGEWSAVASMNTARADMDQQLLSNGEVLTCGGVTSNTNIMTDTCEVYNPSQNSWTYTASLPVTAGLGVPGYPMIEFTSGPLNGEFLVSGGFTNGQIPVANAELYDPTTGTWAYTGSMNQERARQTATLLSDGTVLVTGGYGGADVPTDTAEIYDPDTSSWSYTGSLSLAVSNSSAVTLSTGQVLIIGGIETATFTPVDNAWLYGGPALSTGEVSFPATTVASVSAARRVSFSNRGPRKVWLSPRLRGAGSGQFALDAVNCKRNLRPGGRCVLKVCLAPVRAGRFTTHLQVVVRGHTTLSVLLKGRARYLPTARQRQSSVSGGGQPSVRVRTRGPDRLRYAWCH